MGTLKVTGRDCFEAFLPCGIPDLKLGRLIVHHKRFYFEVDADRGHEVVSKDIVRETDQQGRFANA